MSVLLRESAHGRGLQPLENGEQLEAEEFLRRYESMPELKKAELIQGVVYMGSPVRADQHGIPDNIIQTWAGVYCTATIGVQCASNSTVRLGSRDVPQPDVLIKILSEYGGRSRLDASGYIVGAPELVTEVAASSSALDAHDKRQSYLNAGAPEYLLWRTLDQEVDWWVIRQGQYRPLAADNKGIIRSKVFPGLWLDRAALLRLDRVAVMNCLQAGLGSPEHKVFVEKLALRHRAIS